MKKVLLGFLAFTLFISCKSTYIFDEGSISLPEKQTLRINYLKNLPLVNVSLGNKEYVFLIDTGAPTVISTEIYDFLNLKPKFTQNVTDSNNKKSKQIFTTIPEMNVQGVNFYNIGCIVLDLKEQEFKCYGVDGIIGANQMAKAHWLFNYKEQTVSLLPLQTKVDSNFYDFHFNFKTKSQKTPLLNGKTIGINRVLTFDTGYTGNIKINIHKDSLSTLKEIKKYYGNESVSAFGASNHETIAIFKSDSIKLSNKTFYNEGIITGKSNLIGNSFFEEYQLINWENQKIYFKEIANQSEKNIFRAYDFGFRFLNKKAIITLVEKNDNFPLKIGDEIIAINDTSFENLKENEVCEKYLNFNLKDLDILKIKIKRENEYYTYILNKNKEL